MDVRRLLKVYNFVNDERKSRLNYKFVGALAAFLLVGAAIGGLLLAGGGSGPGGASANAASSEPRTDYVGIPLDTPLTGYDPAAVESAWDDWRHEHPDATIKSREEAYVGMLVYGWYVTWYGPS